MFLVVKQTLQNVNHANINGGRVMQAAQGQQANNMALTRKARISILQGRQPVQVSVRGSSRVATGNKVSRYAIETPSAWKTGQVNESIISDSYGPLHRLERLPKDLQKMLRSKSSEVKTLQEYLAINSIHMGDARELLSLIEPDSLALSVWSPPYYVGKSYESHLTFHDWQALLQSVIALHYPILKPGGFLVINIADILCFKDPTMPKVQSENISRRRSTITRGDVLAAMTKFPGKTRYQLASILGCSEQTIDRRLNGNNIRGGKHSVQTRVKIVGGLIEEWGIKAGFYPYDRRIWVKDAAWENSRWSTLSYRSVDEFEYLYFFWKPGITKVDRARLSPDDWRQWGARGVWTFPSVRANDDHEAKFPVELPRRVIKLLTDPGDVVLDCFMGSGTTAVAARLEDRNFIGTEISQSSVKLARKRLDSTPPKQTDLLGRL